MKGKRMLILKEEVFKGNLLDIGMKNYGIMYNAYKWVNQEISVDYLAENDEGSISQGYYDNCVLLFSLSKIFFEKSRLRLLNEVSGYLNKNGNLYIWDIDKKSGEIWNDTVKIQTPDKRTKTITIRDLNFIKDNSKEKTLKLLGNQYEVIDFNCEHGVYYIKANKKREKERNESCAGSS